MTMVQFFSFHKTSNIFVGMLVICELLCPLLSVPVLIKNSIKVDKSPTLKYKIQRPSSQKHILSKLMNTINAGKNLRKEERWNEPYLNEILPATTLKLKNAIRVLGYAGNKQIIPIAQQRQASATLPFDVVVMPNKTG